MRALFVNELGGGLGHLMPLIAVASALGPAWDRHFVLPDPGRARSLITGHLGDGTTVGQGPAWPPPARHTTGNFAPTFALADALHVMGLSDAATWLHAMASWSTLIEAARPDLVIVDAAPGVRLAAAGRVPVLSIGNGYSMPPPGRLLPSLVSEQPDVPPMTRRREALILAAANEAQAERGGPTLDYVADLFGGNATVVCTLPALDPYRAYRKGQTWWPCAVPLPRARKCRSRARTLLFTYLHADHPALDAVLSLLGRIGRDRAASDVEGKADLKPHLYVLDGDPRRLAEQCGSAVTVHERLVDVGHFLSRTRVLIHHGGTGMSHEALASGAAQLLLPLNLEQVLTSQSLRSLGVGIVVPPPPSPEGSALYAAPLREALKRLLRPDVQTEAGHKADELKASDLGDTLGAIVAACRRLAGGPPG